MVLGKEKLHIAEPVKWRNFSTSCRSLGLKVEFSLWNPFMRNKKLLAAGLLGGLMVTVALLRFLPLPLTYFSTFESWTRETAPKQGADSQAAAHDRDLRLQIADQRFQNITRDAQVHMLATVKAARDETEKILAHQRHNIPRLTAEANEKLQGYGNAMNLARFMAEDKVRGTHKTQDYLQASFQPVVQAQALTEARVQQVLKVCTTQLNVEMAQVQAQTAQILDAEGFKPADLGLEKRLQALAQTQTQMLKASMSAAVATIEVAIEAALVKTTYAAISKLLAKAVAKEVASLAIGAEGAPIPVVDFITTAIAIGGTVWTAFDVHHTVQELEKVQPVIRTGLEDSVAHLEHQTRETFAGLETTTKALFSQS